MNNIFKFVIVLLVLIVNVAECEHISANHLKSDYGHIPIMHTKEIEELLKNPTGGKHKPKPTPSSSLISTPTVTSTFTLSSTITSTNTVTSTFWSTLTSISTSTTTCTPTGTSTCTTSEATMDHSILLQPSVSVEYTTTTETSTLTQRPTMLLDETVTAGVYYTKSTVSYTLTSAYKLVTPIVVTELVETSVDVVTQTIPVFYDGGLTTATYSSPMYTITTFSSTSTVTAPAFTTSVTLLQTVVSTATDTAIVTLTGTQYSPFVEYYEFTATITKTEVLKEDATSQVIYSSAPLSISVTTMTTPVEVTVGTSFSNVAFPSMPHSTITFTETSYIIKSAAVETLVVTSTSITSWEYIIYSAHTVFTPPSLSTVTQTVTTSLNLVDSTVSVPMYTTAAETVTTPVSSTTTVTEELTTIYETPTVTVFFKDTTTTTITPIALVSREGNRVDYHNIRVIGHIDTVTRNYNVAAQSIEVITTTAPVPTSTAQAISLSIHGAAICTACLSPEPFSCGGVRRSFL